MRASKLAGIILLASLTGLANANEIHEYADPLPMANYVDDVDAMLEQALNRAKWQRVEDSDSGVIRAFISYRDLDMTVQIVVENQSMRLILESVRATDCVKNCPDLGAEPAIQMLLRLRRTIAYEVTLLVRDKLAQ